LNRLLGPADDKVLNHGVCTLYPLLGETGVGTNIFARALHKASRRAKRQMFSLNCAAIPESLMDAKLFGVRKAPLQEQTSAGRMVRSRRRQHALS
jgi:DNA-binding NtrC family response regulator